MGTCQAKSKKQEIEQRPIIYSKVLGKSAKYLPIGVRCIIYSFLEFEKLVKITAKISKYER